MSNVVEDTSESSLQFLKIMFILVIIIIAFLSGTLPYFITACRKNINSLGIANAFSGGIFLAIALIHILPEASEDYRQLMNAHKHVDAHPEAPISNLTVLHPVSIETHHLHNNNST
jgi:cbb3-type cytochrome oxidase subunit 1